MARTLGVIGDTRAVDILLDMMGGDDSFSGSFRQVSATALGQIGDLRAIPALVLGLEDWETNEASAQALSRIGWTPSTTAEKMHYWVALRDKRQLLERWGETTEVLLEDLLGSAPICRREWREEPDVDFCSADERRLHNACKALLILGRSEMIPFLIEALHESDNDHLAYVLLGSRNRELVPFPLGEFRVSQPSPKWALTSIRHSGFT